MNRSEKYHRASVTLYKIVRVRLMLLGALVKYSFEIHNDPSAFFDLRTVFIFSGVQVSSIVSSSPSSSGVVFFSIGGG